MPYSLRFFSLGLLLILARPAVSQSGRPVRADVSAVTVFRDRAQLTAAARATVDEGVTEVAVGNLPVGLDPATIQVAVATENAEAGLTLLGVEVRQDFGNAVARRAPAQDSLLAYETQVRALRDQKEILEKEEAALAAALGQGKKDADDQEEAADFFRSRATNIRAQIQKHDLRLQRLEPLLQAWRVQAAQYSAPTALLVLTLSAQQRAAVSLHLTYVTTSAGWEPLYDLRAQAGGTGPVRLIYKAAVYQRTGADWRNVRLTLSGGAPVVGGGGGMADLQPMYARIERPIERRLLAAAPRSAPMEADAGWAAAASEPETGFAEQSPPPPPVSTGRDGSAIHFELENPYTVPADGRPHTVEVRQGDLPAAYSLVVVPKLDPTAFLTAAVTGWEAYNLLPGRANTYLDGTFTGAFDLDPARAVDTLRLTLGPDRNVVVRREKSSEYSKRAFLGGGVTDAVSYVVTAKNLRPAPVRLRIEDQIPRAADSRISVTANELSGATLDDATGRVTWQTRLQPAETRAWKLAYEIKYPKKVVVTVE